MVHLPRICEFCGTEVYHYAACDCPKATLQAIDAEREMLKKRIAVLDSLETNIRATSKIDG